MRPRWNICKVAITSHDHTVLAMPCSSSSPGSCSRRACHHPRYNAAATLACTCQVELSLQPRM
jgi:hypothetical protein